VRVLLPLPDRDFDVTEVAVPWAILRDAGHHVVFATEKAGTVPAADPRLLTGVLFGQLGAAAEARKLYYELIGTPEFGSTVAWADLDPAGFDGLILPGGHAPGMRQYLGSPVLSEQVGRFWRLNRPVGAICHGVLVLARTRDPDTGRSVLADRRTTCLPKYMERSAYLATAWRLGRYYRTYPAYVEDEVRAALDNPDGQFERGPVTLSARGSATDDGPAFVVPDRNYVSARWPGDAYLFGRTVRDLLESARSLYRTDRSIRPDDRHLASRPPARRASRPCGASRCPAPAAAVKPHRVLARGQRCPITRSNIWLAM
jgi:putative intracellular protease/amidase